MSEADLLKGLDNIQWGFIEEDTGAFTPVPKLPLLRAGHTAPPFDVTMPDGTTRRILARSGASPVEIAPPDVAPPKVKVKRKIKVYTGTKLNNASFIRDTIAHWPEIEVTSRWPFSHVDGDSPLWPEDCAAHGSIFWIHDEEDVRRADVVLVFGYGDAPLKGALVEAGMAIGLGKRVIVVGENPSYSTWQYHPLVYRVRDMDTARSFLTLLATDMT